MAPILSFSAAEAWEHLQADGEALPLDKSIFFADFPRVDDLEADPAFTAAWEKLLAIRGEITRVLEAARRDKVIGLALDAEVLVQAEGETAAFLAERWALLQEICIVSKLVRVDGFDAELAASAVAADEVPGLRVAVRPAPGAKCERCWTIATSVGQEGDHSSLCSRCAGVVRSLGA
jgi:isoleucyl-tRNA synthetase